MDNITASHRKSNNFFSLIFYSFVLIIQNTCEIWEGGAVVVQLTEIVVKVLRLVSYTYKSGRK